MDNVLQRMTIIGVLLCFRGLAQEALYDVGIKENVCRIKGLGGGADGIFFSKIFHTRHRFRLVT